MGDPQVRVRFCASLDDAAVRVVMEALPRRVARPPDEWTRPVGAVVVSGVSSGVGKTTVSAGIARALADRGVAVQPFKVGPDFLDGKHLEEAARPPLPDGGSARGEGRPCVNLDGWLLGGRQQCVDAFADAMSAHHPGESCEDPIVAVIEGCMGLFDGRDGGSEVGSTAEIAKWLGAPVVLVLDCSATARSAAAQLRGFQVFDPDVRVEATVLNRVYMAAEAGGSGTGSDPPESPHLRWLREAIADAAVILGALPKADALALPERHLGLCLPRRDPRRGGDPTASLGAAASAHLDLDAVLRLAMAAHLPPACARASQPSPPDVPRPLTRDSILGRHHDSWPSPTPPTHTHTSAGQGVTLGVAWDSAFCFYYHDNLRILERAGVRLVRFSPLTDVAIPSDVNALYLGGGYPELYAEALEANVSMRTSVRAFALGGGPVYAECGGLMYLGTRIDTSAMRGDTSALKPRCGVSAGEKGGEKGGERGKGDEREGARRAHGARVAAVVADTAARAHALSPSVVAQCLGLILLYWRRAHLPPSQLEAAVEAAGTHRRFLRAFFRAEGALAAAGLAPKLSGAFFARMAIRLLDN